MVERAPFAARPDTVDDGDLLGPFDGIVVDAETERPVAGATVAASWAFERGIGLVGPAGAEEQSLETDADGRYRIGRLDRLPSGASTRLRRFTLVVYRRGYVGWRSDVHFADGTPRRDFTQRGNRVRLEKWRAGDAHHRHLVFLGGGPAVRRAAAWEVEPAALELEGGVRLPGESAATSGGLLSKKLLDASALLTEDEIRGVTGYAGAFELSRLTDLPRTEFYDSQHWKAVGQPETYDVGLRVWALGPAAAEAEYRRVLSELPGAQRTDDVGDSSVRAESAGLRGVAFLVRVPGVVVSLSCGVAQCSEREMVVKLAKLVESRLPDLKLPAAARESGEAEAPAPSSSPPAGTEAK